jgi:hypothetical protein
MLLQSISMFNHQNVSIPWALVEYDAAFVMAIPDFKKRKGYVSGAIRNKITPSQLFLRSFVQLEKAKKDNMFRSNVLSIDRLVYPGFDLAHSASDKIEMSQCYVCKNHTFFILEFSANMPTNKLHYFILYS